MNSGQLKFLLEALGKYYGGKIVIIGGMASIAHGVERSTVDVDFMFDGKDFEKVKESVEKILEKFGQITMQAKKESHPSSDDSLKNSLIVLFDEKKGRLADFIGSYHTYEKEGLSRSIKAECGDLSFEIIDSPYLILMKLLANGPKDKLDIYEIYRLAGEGKRKNIETIVEKFGKTAQLRKVLSLFDEN